MNSNKSVEINLSDFQSAQVKPAREVCSYLLAIGALIIALFLPALALSKSPKSPKSPTSPASRQPAQRIKFAVGAISAHVTGQFTPANDRVRYLIKAKAGDHMIVNVIPVTKTLTMAGTIKTPSGEGDGGPGGIIMNSDLTDNGDYTIEVFQHTMGSNLATGKFILEVVITPAWLKS